MKPVIFLLAIGLSMDAFTVSISGGLICKKVSLYNTLKTAAVFGAFQAAMPFLGYKLGTLFVDFATGYGHYVTFLILFLIGARMIYQGIKSNGDTNELFFRIRNILSLGLATSIDAFLAGFGLSLTGMPIIPAIAVIGSTTFIFSFTGVKLGCMLGRRIKKAAEITGGLILIFLGISVLLNGLGIF